MRTYEINCPKMKYVQKRVGAEEVCCARPTISSQAIAPLFWAFGRLGVWANMISPIKKVNHYFQHFIKNGIRHFYNISYT